MLKENALTTLETVKRNLSNSELDIDDELLTQKINEVSDFIASYTDRRLEAENYQEKYTGNNGRYLRLKQYPVSSLQSVQINNTDIFLNEIDLYEDTGILYRDKLWPVCGSGRRNIVVNYEAGYILPKDHTEEKPRTLPYDLEGACIVMATIKYQNRDAEGLTERRVGMDFTEKYLNDIPTSIKLILDLYKRRS
ncbi:MAG TPA: hypothetical protein VHP38_17075 [Ruminiclostridium sp.]|nr:hypothetical protein [Ruminiclostridium sp.]